MAEKRKRHTLKQIAALAGLTPQQKKFVQLSFENPNMDGPTLWALIQPSASREVGRQRSYTMRHNPKVKKAMLDYGRGEYQAALPLAIGTAVEILKDPKSKDRARVLHGLLDRIGMHEVREERHTHTLNIADMRDQLRMLLQRPHVQGLLPAPVITDGSEVTIATADYAEASDD